MFCMLSSFNGGVERTHFLQDYWFGITESFIWIIIIICFIIIAVAVKISLFYRTICTTVKV